MPVFEHREFDGHEQVVFCHDPLSGLKAIIAIHNTSRGPALGGCRMWPYASEAEALTDVLRLSRGMTRSEEHTSELQSLMRISYAVFCLQTKSNTKYHTSD